MTQEDLARALGVTRQTVIAIESGRYAPSLPLALRLARVFGVRVEDLFELVGDARDRTDRDRGCAVSSPRLSG